MSTVSVQFSRHGKRAPTRLDGRSYSGRRAKELAAIYAAALGGEGALSDLVLVRVQDAAELQAAVEHARGQYLRGRVTDETRVVRLTNAASRALRALKLDRVQQSKPPVTLADYVAQKQRQSAADAISGAAAPSEPPLSDSRAGSAIPDDGADGGG
jgi:hypothetical protein